MSRSKLWTIPLASLEINNSGEEIQNHITNSDWLLEFYHQRQQNANNIKKRNVNRPYRSGSGLFPGRSALKKQQLAAFIFLWRQYTAACVYGARRSRSIYAFYPSKKKLINKISSHQFSVLLRAILKFPLASPLGRSNFQVRAQRAEWNKKNPPLRPPPTNRWMVPLYVYKNTLKRCREYFRRKKVQPSVCGFFISVPTIFTYVGKLVQTRSPQLTQISCDVRYGGCLDRWCFSIVLANFSLLFS